MMNSPKCVCVCVCVCVSDASLHCSGASLSFPEMTSLSLSLSLCPQPPLVAGQRSVFVSGALKSSKGKLTKVQEVFKRKQACSVTRS